MNYERTYLFEVRVSTRPDPARPKKLSALWQDLKLTEEAQAEIVGLLDAVPRARLNQILDKIAIEVHMDDGNQLQFKKGSDWTIRRVREEIQKSV